MSNSGCGKCGKPVHDLYCEDCKKEINKNSRQIMNEAKEYFKAEGQRSDRIAQPVRAEAEGRYDKFQMSILQILPHRLNNIQKTLIHP